MKISVIDSSYPLKKMQYGVSASYLFWELSRHGITPTQHEYSDFVSYHARPASMIFEIGQSGR